MQKNMKPVNASKILPFVLLFGLTLGGVNKANAQSWTKRDLKESKRYGAWTYVYRYVNVVVSADTNEIVIKDLNDNQERVLKPNNRAIYLTGRTHRNFDISGNSHIIPTEDIKDVFKPGDTVAVQMDTWFVTGFKSCYPEDVYEKQREIPMEWSDDPKQVVTLYVPNADVFLKNRNINPTGRAMSNKQHQR